MADYKLSPKAVDDLAQIYEYTIESFGLEQGRVYLQGLHDLCQTLADNPMLGRSASELAPELRAMVYQSHRVFHKPHLAGVLIVRVLHQRMDPERHLESSTND